MLTLLCCHFFFFCCHFKSFKRSAYGWDLQMCACIHGFCFFYWFDLQLSKIWCRQIQFESSGVSHELSDYKLVSKISEYYCNSHLIYWYPKLLTFSHCIESFCPSGFAFSINSLLQCSHPESKQHFILLLRRMYSVYSH